MNALNQLELPVLNWIAENLHCAWLDVIMPIYTQLGSGFILIALAIVLLIIPKTRKTGCMLAGAYILGGLFGNLILKNLFARTRPYDLENALFTINQLLVPALSDFSFPSGHTLICAEAASVLMFRARKPWGWIAVVCTVLIMFSRLYLYVHYPSDVLVGAILGTLFGWISVKLISFIWAKVTQKQTEGK